MKLTDVNSNEAILQYIEGCLNDFEAGIATKSETQHHLADLVLHIACILRGRDKERINFINP